MNAHLKLSCAPFFQLFYLKKMGQNNISFETFFGNIWNLFREENTSGKKKKNSLSEISRLCLPCKAQDVSC